MTAHDGGTAPRVAVIGGGVSGLTAAYRLRCLLGADASIVVCEAGEQLGGKVRTATLAGRPFDMGPEAFLARRPEATELAAELGMAGELVHPTGVRSRLRSGGALTGLPGTMMMGIPAAPDAAAGVLSEAGSDRVAAEQQLAPVALGDGDRSLGALLRERFGDELVDRLVDPLLGGVYAGGADGLGVRATMPGLAAALDDGAGSVTAAAARLLPANPSSAPVFATCRNGLGSLLESLVTASAAEIRTSTTVRSLVGDGSGRWRLTVGAAAPEHAPRAATLDVDGVVVATPAPSAARLFGDACPAAAREYDTIELASMAVVSLALPPGTELPEASGTLLGAGERRADGSPFAAKAFTFSARKWPHHGGTDAPVPVRGSVGRFGEPGALRYSDEELLRQVRTDLAEISGITAEPVDSVVTRWGGGLPQYGVGHGVRVERIERALADVPGLEVAGAALHGVGIPACIGTADAAARRLAGVLPDG